VTQLLRTCGPVYHECQADFYHGLLGPIAARTREVIFPEYLHLIPKALLLGGAYLLTVAEGSKSATYPQFKLRMLNRLGAFLSLVFLWIIITGSEKGDANEWIKLLSTSFALFAYLGILVYLREFAWRLEDSRLVRFTTLVIWGGGICGTIAVVESALLLAMAAIPDPYRFILLMLTLFGAGGLVIILATTSLLMVFGVLYTLLLGRYRSAFASVIATAKVQGRQSGRFKT